VITFRKEAKLDKQSAILFLEKTALEKKRLMVKNAALRAQIFSLAQSGRFTGESAELFPIFSNKQLILLCGLGKSEEVSPTSLRVAVRKAVVSSFLKKLSEIEILPHEDKEPAIQGILEGILIGGYTWKKYLTPSKDDPSVRVEDKKFFIAAAPQKSYEEAIAVCQGVNLARDLINDNADTVSSDFIEGVMKKLGSGQKHVSWEILNRRELEKKGLNLHLAVNQASPKEPKLIIVKYQGGAPRDPYTALVGKGITFDTGGLNLKPTGSMETMRSDMSGAAAVVGVLKNVIALRLKKNILFACALAENAIGSRSYKPGDVIKSYSGKTVEIGNTDAEGRLVLADAIFYIVKNYKPTQVIDVATLTGACVVALGHDYSGLVSCSDELAEKLLRSAKETDDRAWRLPSYPEIKEYVKSKIADIKNVGIPKGAAGALTAAEFLRQFTGDLPWAHFDIAGTAFVEGSDRMYFGYGATGAGVRLLTHYLKNH